MGSRLCMPLLLGSSRRTRLTIIVSSLKAHGQQHPEESCRDDPTAL